MDLIKTRLAEISNGCITSMFDIVVYRVADKFIVGESITLAGERLTIDDASRLIYEMAKA